MTPDEKTRKRLPAEKAELFDRLLNNPDINELAQFFYSGGYRAGRARGVAEERLDRARQRKGRKGNAKRPGRPQKIDDLMLELLQKVVKERSPEMTQAEAIEEFQRVYKQLLRDEDPMDLPFLDMDPDSILATMRQRLRQKE